MKNLLVSGSTNEMVDWDIDDVLTEKSRKQDRDRITDYSWDNRISRCGLTYLETEQINYTFNLK